MLDASDAIPAEHFPRCAKCDMPVESFYMDAGFSTVIFVARCHGDVEIVEIPFAIWDWAMTVAETFNFGPAFAGPQQQENAL